MSHFSVLVIGDNIKEQLQPYHEFECTGKAEKYVVEVDETSKARQEYENHMTRKLKGPDGLLHDPYDARFYREPTAEELRAHGPMIGSGCSGGLSWGSRDWGDGTGYRAKIQYIPEGYADVTVRTLDEKSFLEFVVDYYDLNADQLIGPNEQPDYETQHKYHYVRRSGETVLSVIRRTNQEAKWDWWVLGGRWGGFFWLKDGKHGTLGEPSTFDELNGDMRNHEKVDQARKGDINFAVMRAETIIEASTKYDRFTEITAGLPWPESWESVRTRMADSTNIDQARVFYQAQSMVKAMRESREFGFFDEPEDFGQDRDAYIARCARKTASTFAIVKDSQWYEKGEMGWFGCVSNEKDEDAWLIECEKLIDGLPDDTLLSIVDCHI